MGSIYEPMAMTGQHEGFGSQSLAQDQSYPNPPITEAVLEFRFAEPVSKRALTRLSKQIGRSYSTVQPQKEVQFQVNVKTRETEYKSEVDVFRHTSEDQADIFIARPDMLIWSRLAPYEGWNSFMERVHAQLVTVLELLKARKFSRIGMRYINRIDVPPDKKADILRYEDYLSINIMLPQELDPLDSYYWRIERQFRDLGLGAMMQSATLVPEIPGMGSFLLDIDVFTSAAVPVKIDEIFTRLDEMRTLKNALFERAITRMARDSFR